MKPAYNKNKKQNQKQQGMKPEVKKIFEELEEYHDYCRFQLCEFNPAHLFKSKNWQRFNEGRKRKAAYEQRELKRQQKKLAELAAKHGS